MKTETPAPKTSSHAPLELRYESQFDRCAIVRNGSIVASGLKEEIAKKIVKSVNTHDSLVNAVQCAESILSVDFATPDTVEGRRALSFVNSLRTLLTNLSTESP